MARKTKQDEAKAKAAKQKKIAIGGAVILAALLAIELPKTMKMLNQKPAPLNVVGPTTTTASPTVTPTDPNSLAAPTLAGTPVAATPTVDTSNLVSAVPVSADPGQLEQFQKFATKDPFATQVTATGSVPSPGGSGKPSSGSSTPTVTPAAPSTPSAPSSPAVAAPAGAIISLNGELMSVAVKSDFPSSGVTFNRFGALFHLVSLTAKTAKIAVAGGSYASGAPTITLHMGTPVTLQNTADGTKYTLVLEPPTTQLPTGTGNTPAGSGAGGTPTTTTPTSTVSAVPSGSSG